MSDTGKRFDAIRRNDAERTADGASWVGKPAQGKQEDEETPLFLVLADLQGEVN